MLHCKYYINFHKKKNSKLKKYAYDTKNRLNWVEKKEQQKKDQLEKERLRLLWDNEFDKYLSLLKQSKNQRLQHIIEETNKYLANLGARIQIEKDQAWGQQPAEESKEGDEEEKKADGEDPLQANKMY